MIVFTDLYELSMGMYRHKKTVLQSLLLELDTRFMKCAIDSVSRLEACFREYIKVE